MGRVKKIYKVDNSQCRKCLFRCTDGGALATAFCGYMYYTEERRPSPPSPDCTAFVKFRKKERQKLEKKIHSLVGVKKYGGK